MIKPHKVYEGVRDSNGSVRVTVGTMNADGVIVGKRDLDLRLDLRNHSPTGFEWGYGGSGPSQLALALLVDALGDPERAKENYQHYKWQFVATFPTAGWRITEEQVRYDVDFIEGKS